MFRLPLAMDLTLLTLQQISLRSPTELSNSHTCDFPLAPGHLAALGSELLKHRERESQQVKPTSPWWTVDTIVTYSTVKVFPKFFLLLRSMRPILRLPCFRWFLIISWQYRQARITSHKHKPNKNKNQNITLQCRKGRSTSWCCASTWSTSHPGPPLLDSSGWRARFSGQMSDGPKKINIQESFSNFTYFDE